ncbi:MAG: NAD(P)/FAD-dependent oxidoreductase [Actinomycetota bacterium]
MTTRQRIVVIGAGYAGVMAANRLAGSKDFTGRVGVTVINPLADFVERIRLHQVAAGSWESASVPMESVLHPAATLVVGRASRIDARAHTVHFDDGRAPLHYDFLVYAPGSANQPAPSGSVGYALHDAQSAKRLRPALEQLAPGAVVSVIGGGLTGIEAAAEIAEAHPRLTVRLVSRGQMGADLSDGGRRALLAQLKGIGVHVMEGLRVDRSDGQYITLTDGTSLASDCTVWTAGFTAPDLARASGLATDAEGRLLVDSTLACPEFPEIFGAGDAVHAPDLVASHLRMSCAMAMPMGAHAADNVIARIRQRSPQGLSAGFMLRCISLGRRSGLVQPVHADDSPRRFALGSRGGALVKERICRMTLSWIRGERRRSGSYSWPRGPRTAAAK